MDEEERVRLRDGSTVIVRPVRPEDRDLFKPLVGRGSAFLDFNNDGNLDVVLVENNGRARLLRNDNTLGNKSVRLTHISPLLYDDPAADGEALVLLLEQAVERRGERDSPLGHAIRAGGREPYPIRTSFRTHSTRTRSRARRTAWIT